MSQNQNEGSKGLTIDDLGDNKDRLDAHEDFCEDLARQNTVAHLSQLQLRVFNLSVYHLSVHHFSVHLIG